MDKTQKIILTIGGIVFVAMMAIVVMTSGEDAPNPTQEASIPDVVDGIPEKGVRALYYDSGKVQAELHFENSTLNGVSKYYDEEGVLTSEVEYVDGEMNGTATSYYPSGQVSAVVSASNDALNGEGIHYYEDGRVKAKEQYQDHLLMKRVRYNENGDTIFGYEFEKGDTPTKTLIFLYNQLHEYYEAYGESFEESKKLGDAESEDQLLAKVMNLMVRGEEINYLINNAVNTNDPKLIRANELLNTYSAIITTILDVQVEAFSEEEMEAIGERSDAAENEFLEIVNEYSSTGGISINPFTPFPANFDFDELTLYGWSVFGMKVTLMGMVYLGAPIFFAFIYLLIVGLILGRSFNSKFRGFIDGKISAKEIKSPGLQFIYGVHLILLLPMLYFVLALCVPSALMLGVAPVYVSYQIGYIYYWLVLVFAGVALLLSLEKSLKV